MDDGTSAARGRAGDRLDSQDRLRRSAWRWVRAAAVLLTLWLGYQLLLAAQAWALALLSVLFYVLFGSILALIAAPVVSALAGRGVPRPLAVGGVAVVGLVALAGIGAWVGTSLASEASTLASQAPRWAAHLQSLYGSRLAPLLGSGSAHLDPSSLLRSGGTSSLRTRLPQIVIGGVAGTLQGLADVIIVLVVAIWLLSSGSRLRDSFLGYLPSRERALAAYGLEVVTTVFGGYIRAQLLVALMIGVLAGLGCQLLGVPFPVIIAVVAGVFELIPVVGPFAGGAVALLLAATTGGWLVLWTLLLFLGIHALEGYIVAPRVQGHFVRVHPLIAFLALFAGFEVGGFVGALLAVPVASMLAVFLRAAADEYRARNPERFAEPEPERMVERKRELASFGTVAQELSPRRVISAADRALRRHRS